MPKFFTNTSNNFLSMNPSDEHFQNTHSFIVVIVSLIVLFISSLFPIAFDVYVNFWKTFVLVQIGCIWFGCHAFPFFFDNHTIMLCCVYTFEIGYLRIPSFDPHIVFSFWILFAHVTPCLNCPTGAPFAQQSCDPIAGWTTHSSCMSVFFYFCLHYSSYCLYAGLTWLKRSRLLKLSFVDLSLPLVLPPPRLLLPQLLPLMQW